MPQLTIYINSPATGTSGTEEPTAASGASKPDSKAPEVPSDWPSLSNITIPSAPPTTPTSTEDDSAPPTTPTSTEDDSAQGVSEVSTTTLEPETVGSTDISTDAGEDDASNEVRKRRLERFTQDEPKQETKEMDEREKKEDKA
jgi:hypothetical protein